MCDEWIKAKKFQILFWERSKWQNLRILKANPEHDARKCEKLSSRWDYGFKVFDKGL